LSIYYNIIFLSNITDNILSNEYIIVVLLSIGQSIQFISQYSKILIFSLFLLKKSLSSSFFYIYENMDQYEYFNCIRNIKFMQY